MNLQTTSYLIQKQNWPSEGRYILAQYDEDSIIVYQAYRYAIGDFAAANGYFGGEFSYNRMSWIKPNFLWMMYRSGWGTKPGQEVILAIRLKRDFFDEVLAQAVPSSIDADLYPDQKSWKNEVASSSVRLQWDPDHAPDGTALKRRALQLGLRGSVLKEYGRDAIIEIIDISEFVIRERLQVATKDYSKLVTPTEHVYVPSNPEIGRRLNLSK